jgi:hypothetical protein
MIRIASFCFFGALLFWFAGSAMGGVYNEGMIDKDLSYRDFKVTEDGNITGVILNTSGKLRQGVKLDMWITNISETRIYWRKSLDLGDLAPGARYEVKEPAKGDVDSSLRVEFHFRTQRKGQFRNEGRFDR